MVVQCCIAIHNILYLSHITRHNILCINYSVLHIVPIHLLYILYLVSYIINHYISYLPFRPLLHLALFISPATSRIGLDEPYYISYLYYISCPAFRPPTISCALTIYRALYILTTTSRYSCFCACYNNTAICALTPFSPYFSGFRHPPCIYTCRQERLRESAFLKIHFILCLLGRESHNISCLNTDSY